MAYLAVSFLSRRFLRSGALLCLVALGASCSTLHEADMAANRGYNEFGTPAYKPSLSSPKATAKTKAATTSRTVARIPSKTQYSPMVERTVTGVKVVQGFSPQAAKTKPKSNSAQASQAARTQQNTKLTKAYNAGNLLDR